MDHDLYRFSAQPTRPHHAWPEGSRLACWLALHLEYWELETPPGHRRAPEVHGHWGTQYPDTRTWTHREFGNRVGMFRVLDVLDAVGVPVTVAANAVACERYERIVDELRERGYEFAAHGTHATRLIASHLAEADEREIIRQSIRTVSETTGQRPIGWIGQDYSESMRTVALLTDEGMEYVADWPNDDEPYLMTNGMVSIPRQYDLDDLTYLWLRQQTTWTYPDAVRASLRSLCDPAAPIGTVLGLSVHPWLFGQPHRTKYLHQALDAVLATEGCWLATAGDIARAYRNPADSKTRRIGAHRDQDPSVS